MASAPEVMPRCRETSVTARSGLCFLTP